MTRYEDLRLSQPCPVFLQFRWMEVLTSQGCSEHAGRLSEPFWGHSGGLTPCQVFSANSFPGSGRPRPLGHAAGAETCLRVPDGLLVRKPCVLSERSHLRETHRHGGNCLCKEVKLRNTVVSSTRLCMCVFQKCHNIRIDEDRGD